MFGMETGVPVEYNKRFKISSIDYTVPFSTLTIFNGGYFCHFRHFKTSISLIFNEYQDADAKFSSKNTSSLHVQKCGPSTTL